MISIFPRTPVPGGESHSDISYSNLFALAGREELRGQEDLAKKLYQVLSDGKDVPAPIATRSRERLEVLNEGGPAGLWLERWSRKALHEAGSFKLILEMTAGGMGYRLGRVAGGLLARAGAMGAIGRWLLPRGAGFLGETAAFAGASLALTSPFPDNPVSAYGGIFRSSGVMFASLRAARAVLGGQSALRTSAATYLGIVGNHAAQQHLLHWEEAQPFSVMTRQSLAEAVTFSIGGHVSNVTMGRLLRPLEHSLDAAAARNESGAVKTAITAWEWAAESRAKSHPGFRNTMGDPSAISILMMAGKSPEGPKQSKGTGSLESLIPKIKDLKKSVQEKAEALTRLRYEIREARPSSKWIREIFGSLPKFFQHRNSNIREAARLAYLEATVKLPPSSKEIGQAAHKIAKWISDDSLPAWVRYAAIHQHVPLLLRLPPGHPEIVRGVHKILGKLSKTKAMTEEKRLALPVLGKLLSRLGDDPHVVGKIFQGLQRTSQAVSWDAPCQAQLHRLTRRIQWRHRKLTAAARGESGPAANIFQEVLEGLSSENPSVRQRTLRQIEPLYREIQWGGLRLRFLIDLGVLSQKPKLNQWSELGETLQWIREEMDPNDVHLVEVGIRSALHGEDAVSGYVNALMPSEAWALKFHLMDKHFKHIPSEEVTTAEIPAVLFKLNDQLKRRADLNYRGPDEEPPCFAEARAREIVQEFPKHWKNISPEQVQTLIELTKQGSETAQDYLKMLLELSPMARRIHAEEVEGLPRVENPLPTRSTLYPDAISPLLEHLTHPDAEIRETARRRIPNILVSLETRGEVLHFLIELGKRSQGDKVRQWKELEETLDWIREGLGPMDVTLADLGILAALEGKDRIAERLEEMSSAEKSSLRKYILENYLNGRASEEDLLRSPRVIQQLWPQLENKPSSFPPDSGGLFGAFSLIGLAQPEGLHQGANFLNGALDILNNSGVYHSLVETMGTWGTAGLAFGALMAAYTGSGSKAAELATFLGHQLRLSPERLNLEYPHLPQALDFLRSLAKEKNWSHPEQEQFLISHYLWLSDPNLAEKAMPLLRDPDLGFKSLNRIFSFREKGRMAIDFTAEIEHRIFAYQALKGLDLGEASKVDFISRWNLAGAGKIKAASFSYPLSEGVFSALRAMDQRVEERLESGDSDFNREGLRRTHARFLTSFGQYRRAAEVFAPVERQERIYADQKGPLLKVKMAEHYFYNMGFPELESKGNYPGEGFSWQRKIRETLDGVPASNIHETTLPLNRTIPFHFLYRARRHEDFVDTINQIRKGWLFDLMVKGWQPGSPVPVETLRELMTSVETPHHLPTISAPSDQGFVLVLNGHHRLSTLISLVADGIFPPETLAQVPLEQAAEVRPSGIIPRVFPSPEHLPEFSWADVMQFHDNSVGQIPRLGLNADFRHLR